MQDPVDFTRQRLRGGLWEQLRREKAVNHDQIDLEVYRPQRSGEIAGAFLAGEIKQPRLRLEPRGDELIEIVDVASGRGDLSEAHIARRFRADIADGEHRYAVPLFIPGERPTTPHAVVANAHNRFPRPPLLP